MDRKYVGMSKKMSLALRHSPEKFGLKPDDEGWVDLGTFLAAMRMTREDLEYIQNHSDKKRFVIFENLWGSKIKAYYGHSKVIVQHRPSIPPAVLYHGTTPKTAAIILKEGIKGMSRKYAHHSTDIPTAIKVGKRRHPRPVVLEVDAASAHAGGINFFHGNEEVWLSEDVPPEFIKFSKQVTS